MTEGHAAAGEYVLHNRAGSSEVNVTVQVVEPNRDGSTTLLGVGVEAGAAAAGVDVISSTRSGG